MKRRRAAGPPAEPPAGELFRAAVGEVAPVRAPRRVEPHRVPPAPRPVARPADAGPPGGAHDEAPLEDDSAWLRPGTSRELLRKLRRGHWGVEATLDLHGLTGDEAAAELAAFIARSRAGNRRCVLVVHGKGLRDPGREPVLKRRVRRLLAARDDVLAFVEPRPALGGGGAVLALLKAP